MCCTASSATVIWLHALVANSSGFCRPTSAPNTAELAQRLLLAVRALRVPRAEQQLALTVTVSIDVVTAEHPLEALDTLMRRLDAALCRAKAAGRYRVAICPPELRLGRAATVPA